VKEDHVSPRFTSKEYDVEIRETKLGREEFTRDIPNVSEGRGGWRHLDSEAGVGARRDARSGPATS